MRLGQGKGGLAVGELAAGLLLGLDPSRSTQKRSLLVAVDNYELEDLLELSINWQVGHLEGPALLVGPLTDLHAIQPDVCLESTQQNGLCIKGADSLAGVLCEVEVHVPDALLGSEDGTVLGEV